MSDFNKNIKITVTVIEKHNVESFILNLIDCPFDCNAEELKTALHSVMSVTDYEKLVEDYRKSQKSKDTQ